MSAATRRPRMAERAVQRAAIKLLGYQRIYAVHVPNGAHLAGNDEARARQAAALVADGVSTGFPDLILLDQRQPRTGFIEVKREGKRKPDAGRQEWWRDELQRLGHPWALIDTPEGALEAVKTWGWR